MCDVCLFFWNQPLLITSNIISIKYTIINYTSHSQRMSDAPKCCPYLFGRDDLALTRAQTANLRSYSWPGNVRELKNVI